jgi:hypothetical protein
VLAAAFAREEKLVQEDQLLCGERLCVTVFQFRVQDSGFRVSGFKVPDLEVEVISASTYRAPCTIVRRVLGVRV